MNSQQSDNMWPATPGRPGPGLTRRVHTAEGWKSLYTTRRYARDREAVHSVILMAHPDADLLWVDATGILRRRREDFEHWSVMSVLMRDPNRFTRRVLDHE